MKFLRSFFGLNGSSESRTVIGRGLSVDLRDVGYIKESNTRLSKLYDLFKRYQGTPHELKIRKVYEKTKEVHAYLVSRQRLHELELFHLQHTEHFINAFTAIIDYHQQHYADAAHGTMHVTSKAAQKTQSLFEKFKAEKGRRKERNFQTAEMVLPLNRLKTVLHVEDLKAEAPRLTVPEISINTYTKIPYRIDELEGGTVYEIGYTSTPQEKETFLLYVSAHLGINDISYVGNALVNIPNNNGANPTGIVPLIHWEGFLYALNLNDFRIFPVKAYRKSF